MWLHLAYLGEAKGLLVCDCGEPLGPRPVVKQPRRLAELRVVTIGGISRRLEMYRSGRIRPMPVENRTSRLKGVGYS